MIIQAEACIQDGDAAKFSVPGDDIAFFEVRKKSIQLKDEGLSSRAHGSHEPLKQKSRESSFFFRFKSDHYKFESQRYKCMSWQITLSRTICTSSSDMRAIHTRKRNDFIFLTAGWYPIHRRLKNLRYTTTASPTRRLHWSLWRSLREANETSQLRWRHTHIAGMVSGTLSSVYSVPATSDLLHMVLTKNSKFSLETSWLVKHKRLSFACAIYTQQRPQRHEKVGAPSL